MFQRLAVLAIGSWAALALNACVGEGSVHFRGTVLAGDVAKHELRDSPNPDGLPPIEGVNVYLRFAKDGFYANCEVDPAAKPKTTSNSQGSFDTDVIGFGIGLDDPRFQLCFQKEQFSSYEIVITRGNNPAETNGTKFFDVVLVPQ